MGRSEHRPEVRGARDLTALWRALPAAVLAYPASAWSPERGLATLSDTLRARAWREHCAAATVQSCAERGQNCERPGHCRADALFPMNIGGGAPSWRQSTLFVQWRPALDQWHLLALGTQAGDSLGWAARCLRERHGLDGAIQQSVSTLADLELTGATRWQLNFVTPWLVGKGRPETAVPPDTENVAHELRKAMRLRAHKLTALCFEDSRAQRLASHLAHHVAEALLPDGLMVEQALVVPHPLALASRGNRSTFLALTWSGQAIVRVESDILPWLTLVARSGGGENADKGFGVIELTPLD